MRRDNEDERERDTRREGECNDEGGAGQIRNKVGVGDEANAKILVQEEER